MNTATSNRDILSYTPSSSRDILSMYTPRDVSSSAAMIARESSSYGSAVGSRDILSYATSHDNQSNVTNAGRDVSMATPGREKVTSASRSTSRLPTHRSMTKLNSAVASSSGLDNKIGNFIF